MGFWNRFRSRQSDRQSADTSPPIEGMTVPQLQDLVFEAKGFRPTELDVRIALKGGPESGPQSPPLGQRSPGLQGGMASPGTTTSVFREPTVSNSMSREEFLARFDARVMLGGTGTRPEEPHSKDDGQS